MSRAQKAKAGRAQGEADDGFIPNVIHKIAEIEWLLVLLSALYFFNIPQTRWANVMGLLASMITFAVMIIGLHHTAMRQWQTQWRLRTEILAITAFITLLIGFAGSAQTGLINVYMIVLVCSAITLNRRQTLALTVLISLIVIGFYLYSANGQDLQLVPFLHQASQIGPLWIVGYMSTILAEDIKKAQYNVRRLAERDELTGLFNMRAFYKIGEQQFRHAVRHQGVLSVMVVDVDDLKIINDRYGHEAGNKLLRAVGTMLQSQIRDSDLATRYGGDEFALILPNTEAEGAQALARRLSEKVVSMRFDMSSNHHVRINASVGAATYPDEGERFQELFEIADARMYELKNQRKRTRNIQQRPPVNGAGAA